MAVLTIQCAGLPRRQVSLTEVVTTIGRSVDNVLELPDPNMSRRHCVIEKRDDGDYVVTDCNSSNGTRVNGERIVSHELRDGDRVEMGSTSILFSVDADAADAASDRAAISVLEETNPPDARAAMGMKTTPAVPSVAVPGAAAQAPTTKYKPSAVAPSSRTRTLVKHEPEAAVLAHERDDLRKLLEINKRLNQQHEVRKLCEAIIDSAIELMAAERGFLILVQDGEMKVEIARNMAQDTILANPANAPQVSTQICRDVISTGKPILTTNAAADQRYGRYSSVVGLNLRSILCVPFRIKDVVLGTVYLDNANVGAFSERDADLLSAFSDQAAVAIENARLIRQVKKKERMEQELKIASEIQKKLLPRKTPRVSGLDLYGWMHPAKQVGGDYYDFIPQQNGLLICIGDVSGKGVPAGLVMASARSALRSLAERVHSTKEMVIALNKLLAEDLDREMFLSLLLMRYDAATGNIKYTGAGHEHIVLYRAEEDRVESRKAGGTVLGLRASVEDLVKEEELQLDVGDALVLYTDGVTEAINEKNEQFELDRFKQSVQRYSDRIPREMLHGILGDVLKWKGKAQQRDDITLVCARRTPPGEEVPDDPPTVRARVQDFDEQTDVSSSSY